MKNEKTTEGSWRKYALAVWDLLSAASALNVWSNAGSAGPYGRDNVILAQELLERGWSRLGKDRNTCRTEAAPGPCEQMVCCAG